MQAATPQAEAQPRGTRAVAFRIGTFLRAERARLALVVALLVAGTALGLAHPWLVQQLVDRVFVARDREPLWGLLGLLLAITLARFGASLLQGQVYTALAGRVLLAMRRSFLEQVQRQSLRYFAGTRYGELVVRFNRDLTQIQEFATARLIVAATNVLMVLGVVVAGTAYGGWLFLLAASPLPLAVLAARLYRGRLDALTREQRERSVGMATAVNETLTAQRTVRAHGRERRELLRMVRHAHRLLRSGLRLQWTSAWAAGWPRLCTVLSLLLVYAAGGLAVIEGRLGLGALIALSMYVGMLAGPLLGLVDAWLELVAVRVSLERVRELFERSDELPEDPAAPALPPLRGAIRFERVSFRYERGEPLLEELDFEVAPGERVALVGPSGAGKSTVVDLLFRFLDPQQGRVLVDGRDLRTLRAGELRRSMALVSQDVFLFHDTIRENLRFGRAGATDAEVEAAARAAGVDTMLPAGSAGLETVVGERGARLSGGQRQRIAIARALLRQPKILVLDEATSALDYEAEDALQRMLSELGPSVTIVVVTHRVERWAREARVIEIGTAQALPQPVAQA